MTAADPAIRVAGLSKRFGDKVVVKDFAIEVPRGAIFGFLGPNGSGKTTTIRMLCGLLTPDAGEGQCLGFDIRTQSDEIKPRVGYMTQRFGLYEDMTVRENLEFIGRMYDVPSLKPRLQEILRDFGLAARQGQLAGALSGGWKQRLALAGCVLHEPQLLLLDEPTAGVDPNARREFWEMINALAAQGVTVLVSTHYMDEAERCHEIAYLAYGKLLARGPVEAVIAGAALATWSITGADLNGLARELATLPGVEMVAPFGATLHVSGSDAAALEQALAPLALRVGVNLRRSEPSLEDVFIHLMGGVADNFAGRAPAEPAS